MKPKKRDLLALTDLSAAELHGLLAHAAALKADPHPRHRPLAGKTLAMIFDKSSTRTRVSFEVGAFQLGGHALMLSSRDTQVGRGETVEDTARVLGRYVDGVMIRTYEQAMVERFAAQCPVPVINGLTDALHPCQVLADLLTCREHFGAEALAELRVAYIGDGNNMARSWLNAAAVLGFEVSLASPAGYHVAESFIGRARARGARVQEHASPREAAAGAHVVTTDTWVSMGQEGEKVARAAAFDGFRVDEAVMAVARDEAIFLHCLPAYRDMEVTADVIDGPQSRVWDEAENRLHAQKAVMAWLMGGDALPEEGFAT
ncbi:MAG: ornithine carbamoyltransferase [bacterium]